MTRPTHIIAHRTRRDVCTVTILKFTVRVHTCGRQLLSVTLCACDGCRVQEISNMQDKLLTDEP